jgi:hypothetical protein
MLRWWEKWFAKKGLVPLFAFILAAITSCTGGVKPLAVDQGGMKINPGDSLRLDLGGIKDLNPGKIKVTLRTIDPSFGNLTVFHDITALVEKSLGGGTSELDLILPKSVTPPRPFVVVVEMTEIQDFLLDLVFPGTAVSRPDVNSTLAFSFLESFHHTSNPRTLDRYTDAQHSGVKNLIAARTGIMISQSEHLSLSSIPFDKAMRFFKNGLAFNTVFLEKARDFGVHFRGAAGSMRAVTGVKAADTPENSLDSCFKGFCYQYPSAFEVQLADGSWIPAPQLPFKQNINNPALILPGSAAPDPSTNLSAMEGAGSTDVPKIEVAATGFDEDSDYFEKSIRVIYQPRKLPSSLRAKPGFKPELEETASDVTLAQTSAFEQADRYSLLSIGYHEAFDTDAVDPALFPECNTAGSCDTAYRDVFFMYTDGMAWVPYHWKFRYRNVSRPPVFIKDQNQRINSTHFNAALQAKYQDTPNPLTPEWKVHDSHCETDSRATPPDSPVENYYQQIQSRADGPWSCAFKVTDPDLNDDPNGSLDQIHFGLVADDFTRIYFGAKLEPGNPSQFSTKVEDAPQLFNEGAFYTLMNLLGTEKGAPALFSPPLPPAGPGSPILLKAMTELSGEADCGGFAKCAAGLVQVEIDNAVKVAAEQQASQTFNFTITAFDAKLNGKNAFHPVTRGVLFKPKPPLLINFSNATPPAGAPAIEDVILDPDQNQIHARHDIHLSEIMSLARHATSTNPKEIGLDPDQLLGAGNRQAFKVPDANQSPVEMSPYLTQPRTLCATPDAADLNSPTTPSQNGSNCRGSFGLTFQLQDAIGGRPGSLIKLGSSLRMLDASSYTYPREFDHACNLEENNSGRNASGALLWDQRPGNSGYMKESLPSGAPASRVDSSLGGWSFEINVIDPENIDLRSGEPTDPVYTSAFTDLLYSNSLYFCHPPKPNRTSLQYETYSSTNDSTPNGIDPDSCLQWSSTPPSQLQPIPVYYTGRDLSGNPLTRKYVYHRLRGRWAPRDQGLANRMGNPDPKGVLQGIFKQFKLHGNVFSNRYDTRDLTEPRLVENFVYKKKQDIVLAAERKEMLPCLKGAFSGVDQFIIPQNNSFARTFKVADTNHTNSLNPTAAGAISGRYEAEWELLGRRTLNDFEFLKFIPYLGDCTNEETRDVSTAKLVYDFPPATGATGYTIYTRDPSIPGQAWTSRGVVASPPFVLENIPSFTSLEFKNLPLLAPPLQGQESPAVLLQANPKFSGNSVGTASSKTPVFYSSTVDGSKPKIRFRSLWNHAVDLFNSNAGDNFCYQSSAIPLMTVNGAITGVWKFTRSNSGNQSRLVLNSPLIERCTGYRNIVLEPEYKSLVVGALTTGTDCSFPINSTITTFQGLGPNDPSGTTDVQVQLIFKIDPGLPAFGSLNFPNPANPLNPQTHSMFWFPGMYAADTQATVPVMNGNITSYLVPDVNGTSGLFFKTYPINTFKYDNNNNSPTFGLSSYAGYPGSLQTDTTATFASNTGPIPQFTVPDETKEYNISFRAVDFDSKLVAISTAAPSPDLSATPAPLSLFRNRPAPDGLNPTIQIFSWPPVPGSGQTRTIEFPITSMDAPIGKPEIDPFDVFAFTLATPSPAPIVTPQNAPFLSGWGIRTDCASPPPQFPLQSLLRLDTLSDYKKCKVTWNQREQDAGKIFNYLIEVQDNIGANFTTTPKIMGLGAKHPVSTLSNTLRFRYDPLPAGISQNGTNPLSLRFTIDAPDGPNPGTTLDDTISSCASSGICYRNRIWNSVSASNCNQITRACSINVVNQYQLHYLELIRQVKNLSNNTTYADVDTFELQPKPSAPNDSQPLTNGPPDIFNLQIYSLEHNNAPFFTNASGTQLSNAIYNGPGSGNWSAIQVPSACSGGSSSAFFCNLQVKNGDTLWNSPATTSAAPTPYELQERSTPYTDFRINVRDVANLNDLKTLTVTQPTQVLILDGPYAGLTYSVPSFTNGGLMNWQVSGSVGSATASFQWAPTDLEANLLSNPGGFLIPIKVTDRLYNPQPSETGFPSQFIVPAKESTIWIWCKLHVLNNIPVVQYLIPPSTWRDLSNANIEVATGAPSTLTVRVRDADAARYRLAASERSRSFYSNAPLSGQASVFMSSGTPEVPAGDPSETAPTAVVQRLVLTANPTNDHLGSHSAALSVLDPGDPSLGLAVNPNADTLPRAGLATPVTTASFTVNVVGRPFFMIPPIPAPTSAPLARAFSLRGTSTFSTFDYPLALFVSRLADRDLPTQTAKPHFIGIQIKPAVATSASLAPTLVANTATARGFRVNQDYVLKGRFDGNDVTGDRVVQLGSVPVSTNAALGCNPVLQSTTTNDNSILANNSIAVSLKRIKDTGEVEYCNFSQTSANNLVSQVRLTHTLQDGSNSSPYSTPGTVGFQTSRLDRTVSATNTAAVNSEFLDFSKRCKDFCPGTPSGNGGFTLSGGEITGYSAPAVSYFPTLVYGPSSSGRSGSFVLNDQNRVVKTYIDNQAQTNTVMNSFVLKGEQLSLSVKLSNPPSAPGVQARWYVNGCLRKTEPVPVVPSGQDATMAFAMAVPSTSSGLNNDCSGQFVRTEAGGGFLNLGRSVRSNQTGGYLGDLIVRVVLANASEPVSTSSDGTSAKSYAFHMNVVNTIPMIMTETDPKLRAVPIAVADTSANTTTANSPNGIPSKFIMPFETGTSSLYTYVGNNTSLSGTSAGNPYSSGTSIHVREFGIDGSAGGTFRRDVYCAGFPYLSAGEPGQFSFGIDASAGSNFLKIAASIFGRTGSLSDAYPTGSNSILGSKNTTCYFEFTNLTSALAGSSLDTTGEKAGRILAFSPLRLGSRGATTWRPTSGSSTSVVEPFLIEGTQARTLFWMNSNAMASAPSIFPTLPTALSDYTNNTIVKSMVEPGTNRLVQLVGLRADQFSNFNGAVLISNLSTSNDSTLNATLQEQILFGQGGCTFEGAAKTYPIDGIYEPSDDILFMTAIELPDSGAAVGKVVEIRNFLNPQGGNPRTCRLAGSILTPSRNVRNHNPSNLRLTLDSRSGILWGVAGGNDSTVGQMFSYDYKSKRSIYSVPLDYQPGPVLHSPLINGTHLFFPGSGTKVPALFRVW